MSRVSKADREVLDCILADLDRASTFLLHPRTSVALRRSSPATTVLDFHRDPVPAELLSRDQRPLAPYILTEIAEEIGSDLTGLWEARRRLSQFLVDSGSLTTAVLLAMSARLSRRRALSLRPGSSGFRTSCGERSDLSPEPVSTATCSNLAVRPARPQTHAWRISQAAGRAFRDRRRRGVRWSCA